MSISGESIYNLVPDVQSKPARTDYTQLSRTQSVKLAQKDKQNQKRKAHATLGPGQSSAQSPDQFLRSQHRTVDSLPEPKPFHYSDPVPRRAPIPKRDEQPERLPPSHTNFIAVNREAAVLSIPSAHSAEPVDYTKRRGFGEVPKYLETIKAQVAEEYQEIERAEQERAEQAHQSKARYVRLPEEERLELLDGLRANHRDLSDEYKSFPLGGLTLKQTERRQYLERTLHEIEVQISRLERETVLIEL